MITKFRLWLALKILGTPEDKIRSEAGRLYVKIWPKHIATEEATMRTLMLFMMKQRINERLNLLIKKRIS